MIPNATPPGQLAKYLEGDLGVARRHLVRVREGEIPCTPAVLDEIQRSVETCVARIRRDVPPGTSAGCGRPVLSRADSPLSDEPLTP